MERKEMQLLETGLGNVTWWGYSPSFNILDDVTIPGFAIDGKKGKKRFLIGFQIPINYHQ